MSSSRACLRPERSGSTSFPHRRLPSGRAAFAPLTAGCPLVPRFRTLRFRLAWSHGILVFAVLVCWGTLRYQLLSWRSQRTLDRHIAWDAEFMLSRLRLSATAFSWNRENLTTDQRIRLESLRQQCVITDGQGEVLFPGEHARLPMAFVETGRLTEVLRSRGGFTDAVLDNGDSFRFVTVSVPREGAGAQVFLHLGSSLESVDAVLQEYRTFYLWSLPFILLLSGGVTWYFAGRALRPFEDVASSVEKISLQNLRSTIATGRTEREVQRLVDAFNAMVRRLDESFSQMRRFNSNAAHELRTPLAILQGETELMLRSRDLPEETRALLSSNLEELGRLSRIVNDLLSLADAEVGEQILSRSPVPLEPLLTDLAGQMGTLAAGRNVRLRVGRVSEATVEGDELWLRRAFLNLLDNAVKYSKDEGEVLLSAAQEGGEVRVSVSDNGIGIAPSDLPYVFERLYRADPARSRTSGGSGLGLAMVKWVVEAHGGSVTVESQLGRGSTFVVTLPVLKD